MMVIFYCVLFLIFLLIIVKFFFPIEKLVKNPNTPIEKVVDGSNVSIEKVVDGSNEKVNPNTKKGFLDIPFNYTKKIKATDHNIRDIIKAEISKLGINADLNHIDVSAVTNMSRLFKGSDFNGDISKWNMENVVDVSEMFSDSKFRGDISGWNMKNVVNMAEMFIFSEFNGDISKWNLEKVMNLDRIFYKSKFKGDVDNWTIPPEASIKSIYDGIDNNKIPIWVAINNIFSSNSDYLDSLNWDWINYETKVISKIRLKRVLDDYSNNKLEIVMKNLKFTNFEIKR